ncbi:hypothetical protein FHR81_004047 [Actinoalloteichus hoggarensis]|uniref:Uncharacterized protein n=1 Tax=Actinoalloteichus hoggarensis TaxID=1470176 RepID=A0A221W9S9_9PSEU|nr:hypothetical protein [Actinoalloteichus hoggarensis]ASO22595.1 hypothetical protein AHOG_24950 [Actinoalloteichus hoggarensis]MBB5922980.1 hypothetical protein [Actinoalloteichus hoggarensis]
MRTALRSLPAAALWLLLMLIPVGVATAAAGPAPAGSPVAGTSIPHAAGAEDTTAPATETSEPGEETGSEDGPLFSGEAGGQVLALVTAAALFALVFYGRRIRKKARDG